MNTRQDFTCGCCGSLIGQASPIDTIAMALSQGHQQTIFKLLSRRVGNPVFKEALIDAMYGNHSDGGPLKSDNILSIEIGRMRRKIEALGWMIKSSGGGRGTTVTYRLIPIEAGP